MFEIYQGGKEQEKILQARRLAKIVALRAGECVEEFYLSGGSETRRDARLYYQQYAEAIGVPFYGDGWHCIVGYRNGLP